VTTDIRPPIEVRVCSATQAEIKAIGQTLRLIGFNCSGVRPDKFDPTRFFTAYFTGELS
jgi:hypothetical protein